jgi:hypothetical protein
VKYLQEAMRRNPLNAEYFDNYAQKRREHQDPYDEADAFSRQAERIRRANPVFEAQPGSWTPS